MDGKCCGIFRAFFYGGLYWVYIVISNTLSLEERNGFSCCILLPVTVDHYKMLILRIKPLKFKIIFGFKLVYSNFLFIY